MNLVKKTRRPGRRNQVFLLALPVMLVLAGGVLLVSAKKFLAEQSCGCGWPSAEATGAYQATNEIAVFENKPIDYSLAGMLSDLGSLKNQSLVLGETAGERWIEVDLSDQKLYAHEGDKIAYEFLISSGKWNRTPTGEFRIWIKLRYTKMSGGSRALHTYYYLPNVPYTQYFYNDFGLHGTYWHHNFGQPMSHGCINLAIPDAEKLFYWTSPSVSRGENVVHPSGDEAGTRVIIHE